MRAAALTRQPSLVYENSRKRKSGCISKADWQTDGAVRHRHSMLRARHCVQWKDRVSGVSHPLHPPQPPHATTPPAGQPPEPVPDAGLHGRRGSLAAGALSHPDGGQLRGRAARIQRVHSLCSRDSARQAGCRCANSSRSIRLMCAPARGQQQGGERRVTDRRVTAAAQQQGPQRRASNR